MTRSSISLDHRLHDYLVNHGTPPDELLSRLIDETYAVLPDRAGMQIGPEQSTFMTMLVKLTGARQAVEIGTFTGMSSLSIARGMPEDGKLVCLDVSEEFTAIARRYWAEDGQAGKIELRIGDAKESVRALPAEPHIDFAFIDADKTGYLTYWEELVPRMRAGGLITVDNVLQAGRIVDETTTNENTLAMRRFNDHVAADDRVEICMLPVGDGLTLARKR